MATSPVSKQLYPFATEDSKVIPLDVIRPLALVKKSFPAVGTSALTIPADWKIATFFSAAGCIIQFAAVALPNPPVDNTSYVDALLIPPGCVVTSTVLPGNATVIPLTSLAGYVIAQHIQKWSGLALARQVSKV